MKKINIEDLAIFNKVAPSYLETCGVAQAFKDVGFDDRDGRGLFGRPITEVHLCEQSINSKSMLINGTGGVYILKGSLSVEGDLVFVAYDSYTVFVITGNLTVSENFVQKADCQIIVLGDTTIHNTMWIDLSDAGFSVFRGNIISNHWYQTNDSVTNSLLFGGNMSGSKIEYNDYDENFQSLEKKFEI